jgi:polyhydroxyalkanoate synthesis repressor PhaR
MVRLIKRYESRKLYDTEESRYVSLEDIAGWVRSGQEVRVVDNATSEDVTQQTLTQIILDEGRKGTSFLPNELLHELVRMGERAMSSGVEQLQHGVDRVLKASVDRLAPVRRAREEMALLRQRLEQLEGSLAALENDRGRGGRAASVPGVRTLPGVAAGGRKPPPAPRPARRPGKPGGGGRTP